jgi:thiol-disulfide isomerase/thioredoxin
VKITARTSLAAVAAVGLLAVTTACSSSSPTTATSDAAVPATVSPSPSMKPSKSAPAAKAAPGAFVSYADYQSDPRRYADGDVVLFFNASWCPTCREATQNLTSQSLPDGLTIVDVDYDNNTELRQRYGVTTQHTFVQVDEAGGELVTFTGSTTADQIMGELS